MPHKLHRLSSSPAVQPAIANRPSVSRPPTCRTRIIVLGAYPDSLTNFRGALVRELVAGGHRVIAMSAPADETQSAKIRALGAAFRSYFVKRNGLNPGADLRTLMELVHAFRCIKPHVVLAYTIKPVIWGALAARFCSRVRFVALITGLGFAFQGASFKRRLLTKAVTALYRIALRRAEAVVFQNIDNRNEFVRRHIVPIEKTHIINGSGVDLAHFAETAMPNRPFTFLLIARLLGEKGIREYVLASQLVKSRFPAARCLLIGPEDPSPDGISIEEIKRWQHRGDVEYWGALADVREAIAQCHVYVLPSYHEGMPRTVLEALAVGRPILTTDVPGCRETVAPDQNGFLVPAGDAQALAEKMIWFIENPERIEAMGSASRKLASAWFDVHVVNRRLIEILTMNSGDEFDDQSAVAESTGGVHSVPRG